MVEKKRRKIKVIGIEGKEKHNKHHGRRYNMNLCDLKVGDICYIKSREYVLEVIFLNQDIIVVGIICYHHIDNKPTIKYHSNYECFRMYDKLMVEITEDEYDSKV